MSKHEKRRRIVIKPGEGVDDATAIRRVQQVVSEGKISKTSKGEQYCFVSRFADGMLVYADMTDASHIFRVEAK